MKVLRTVFLAAALVAMAALPAAAGQKAGKLTLSPQLGGILFEGDQDVDDSVAYSLGIGYNLTRALALEAVLAGASTERESSGRSIDLTTYRIDALYHFMPDREFVPYVAAGLGGYDLGSDGEFMADYGAGALYYIAENVALRADVRHLIVTNESNLEHNLLYTVGLKFQFAEPEKPVAAVKPAPLDSDGDGVTDDLDKCPGTPKGTMVDAQGCPLKLTLHINFDFDKAEIKPEFEPEMEKAAAFIRKYPEVPYILIAGHTDSVGDDAYNQTLSEQRAQAVRQHLVEHHGIDGGRLKAKGYGESQPVAGNDSEDGRYQNRRVEVVCCALVPE